jgi:zinc transport system permease protein
MAELLAYPFMQRALIGGVLVGFLASYYGVFVVQRGLSFLGSGLAHAAFGGIALGLLLNAEPLWIAVPFTIFVAVGISWVRERTKLGSDTAVGIFFSVSMALGIFFIFIRRQYADDAFTYLFGSILAVSKADVWMTCAVAFITILFRPFWKRWAYASFDRELSQTDRLHVRSDDYLLVILIAVTVVMAIKVVGIVLIAASLVIPAATARLLSKTFSQMTVISICVGVSTAVLGLFVSFFLDVPSGASIILLQAVIFFLAMIYHALQK